MTQPAKVWKVDSAVLNILSQGGWEICLECREEIVKGDRIVMSPFGDRDAYVHEECS